MAECPDAHMVTAFVRYSRDYVSTEATARASNRGLWPLGLTSPEAYRQASRESPPTTSAPDRNCTIKGNINAKGERIYHLPGTSSYAETVIDPSKGERWFCSRMDAEAAGCRAPRG